MYGLLIKVLKPLVIEDRINKIKLVILVINWSIHVKSDIRPNSTIVFMSKAMVFSFTNNMGKRQANGGLFRNESEEKEL